MSYWSYYQYLQEDKFLLVSDIGSMGSLKLIQVSLTNPKVVCPPRIGSVEKYEKFSVITKDFEYQFEVMFQTTGTQDFVYGSLFDQIMCLLFGIAIAGGVFLWFKKKLNDRDFKKFNAALARRRGLLGDTVEENKEKEGDILDKIDEMAKEEAYADVDAEDSRGSSGLNSDEEDNKEKL